jgi:hypothetical protein
MILEGTTADKMRDIYTRPHRNSIYEPATIHDIPFEVLRESFLLLLKEFGSDLASPSLACRAWRVVALDVMYSRMIFATDNERIERFICGLHLRSIVGLESRTIKHLTIDREFIGIEFINIVSRFLFPTLSSLNLMFDDRVADQSYECYEALDILFKQCNGIQTLKLVHFDFGDDPTSFSQNVKDGFSRLKQLNFINCQGDIQTFVENTPIPNLNILYYESDREAAEAEEIISSLATSYRTLTSVKLFAKFESSASLLKVVECCHELERLVVGDEGDLLILARSDILAVASLPRLKYLEFGVCCFSDDAASPLARCKGLKELRLPSLADPTILAAIGKNLISLDLWKPSKEVVDGIVKHCPNLRYLELGSFDEVDEEVKEVFVGSIRNGLKKLAKFKLDNESIRLGSGWEGY